VVREQNCSAMAVAVEAATKRKSHKGNKKQASAKGGGASFYDGVAQSIGCEGITSGIVKSVCESIRKALIREVQQHGQFRITNLGTFKLKQVHGKPARMVKRFDRHTKAVVEKHYAATPPFKRLSARALAPLQKLFRGSSCEDAPAPCEE
jgi:nucleoid DNA-binding protein